MNLDGKKTNFSMQALNQNQIQKIHESSLQILEKTGIVLQDAEALDILSKHGAKLNDRSRLCIPASLVEKSLETTPRKIPLYNRSGELAMELKLGNIYFGTGSDTFYTLDPHTMERRHTTSTDIQKIAYLCDALPNISFVMSMGTSWDGSTIDNYINGFVSMLRGTTKPIVFTAANRYDMEHIFRISAGVSGGEKNLKEKPFLLNYSEPISPLLFPQDSVQKLLFCAENGIPAAFIPSPNMGGGGPVTMAGALALANAETLAGLVIAQVTQPGAYFLYGANVAVMDMRSMVVCYGSPEWSLSMAAMTDIARFYGLPVWGYCGATDAKRVDAQAGLEACQSTYSALLSGATLNHDIGYIESGLTSSMEMVVMVDEIISMLHYISSGIEVNPQTLALDVIDRVQPGSGFLADEHTLNNWRKSLYMPRSLNRQRYEHWHDAGSPDLYHRLNGTVKSILAKQPISSLPPDVESVIEDVLRERASSKVL
jgi:trimethylamine---corrinoid protein Co-methyltransferase